MPPAALWFTPPNLGGSGDDDAEAIAVDASGNAYVMGETNSTDFPTASPFQASHAGGINDVFVTKLNPTGSALVYSTYLGGSGADSGFRIAVDASGNAYLAGETRSTNFPTASPFQASFGGGTNDGFVTKLNAAGSALVYSTYLGGSDPGPWRGHRRRRLWERLRGGPDAVDQLPHGQSLPVHFRRCSGRLCDEIERRRQRSGLLHLPGRERERHWRRHRGGRLRQRLRDGGYKFDQLPHSQSLPGGKRGGRRRLCGEIECRR